MINNAGFIILVETCIIIVVFLMYKKEKQTNEEKEKEYAEEKNRMEEEIDLQNRRMTEEYAKIAKERNGLAVEREKLSKEKAERTSLDNKTDQEIIRDIFMQNKKSMEQLMLIKDKLPDQKEYSRKIQDLRTEVINIQDYVDEYAKSVGQIDYERIEEIVDSISVDNNSYEIKMLIEEVLNSHMYNIENAVSSAVDEAMASWE